MNAPLAVLIAAADRLPGLEQRLAGAEILSFADTDVLRALEAILTRQPGRVVLDAVFASTTRGMALVSRLGSDPMLQEIEIAVLGLDGTLQRAATRRPAPTPAREGSGAALDQTGTRRAARVRVRDGLDILVDGAPVRLLDLSVLGAQVVSSNVLKPNQRVRVSLVDEVGAIRIAAVIAWARYELPQGTRQHPHYRAGLEFLESEREGVAAFAVRHERRG